MKEANKRKAAADRAKRAKKAAEKAKLAPPPGVLPFGLMKMDRSPLLHYAALLKCQAAIATSNTI